MASENDSYYRRKAFEERWAKGYEYRLYVGVTDLKRVADTVNLYHFPGATFTPGVGLWEGEVEGSTVVTILCPNEHGDFRIRNIAAHLRDRFGQDCVLVTKTPVESTLV